LILGIAVRLAEHPDRIKRTPYLASVEMDGRLVAAAVMTPPHRVVLFSAAGPDPAPLQLILDDLRAGGWNVPGVMAPAATSEAFARLWSVAAGCGYRAAMHERTYELRRVIPPAPAPGLLRPATEADLPLAEAWIYNFMQDARLPGTPESAREAAEIRIGDRDLFLWDHDGPVSMAAKTRHSTHGIVISLVYTPPERRGRGYASACVAALSQQLLDAGWQFCALFTDLANPTSNALYQRIGYRPVGDFDEYDFEP
jgi:predicted GNAT family acetyltransferase